MKKLDVAAAIIINRKGEVLLQKKTFDYLNLPEGYWTLFGGEIEDGENPKETIRREIEEETWILVDKFEFFKKVSYNSGKSSKENIFFKGGS